MVTLENRQIHYRCAFEIHAVPSTGAGPAQSWNDLVGTVRRWISSNRNNKRANTDALLEDWFYTGGQWSTSHNRILVMTRQEIGSGSRETPQFWAVRYEHPCSETTFRQWRTDIGITALNSSHFSISITVSYTILPEYLGEEPEIPIPTAPWLLKSLMDPVKWGCFSGAQKLSNATIKLEVNKGIEFYEALQNPDRKCPLILVSRHWDTGEPKIDAAQLGKVLLGTAVVYLTADDGVEKELDYFLPKEYRCFNGAVRIYWPNADFAVANDYRRHRFFLAEKIDELSPSEVQNMIVRAIARRARHEDYHIVSTIEDIVSKTRELRMQVLRDAGQSTQELVQLQEEEIETLSAKVTRLELENGSLWREFENQDTEADNLREKLHVAETSADYARRECAELRDAAGVLRAKTEILDHLDHLPETLPDVLGLIGRLHSNTIVFTQSAFDSAGESDFADLDIAWRCLWFMATVLHELYFGEQRGGDIGQSFRDQTGFELTLTESKLTKKDRKLMSSRELEYAGEILDITPHVKYGDKSPHCLRVHYHAHLQTKKIIVGHCGNHLDTSGTRRRS